MLRLVARRALSAIPLLAFVLTLTFALLEAAPGDPAATLLGDAPVPPETRARILAAYGLDRPPLSRYVSWMTSAARGDLGWSLSRGRPVTKVLAAALPPTIGLGGAALALQLLLGLAAGTLHAVRPGGALDRWLSVAGLVLASVPTFWLGLMAILLLAVAVPLFPPSSMHSVGAEGWGAPARAADAAWHAALPALVLASGSAAVVARFVRAGLLRSLGEGFARAARARGASHGRVLLRHALPAAAGPVITLAGLQLPFLVSGAVVVEVVFGWPGMGRVTYDAVLAQDLPVVLASVLLATVLVIAGNLLADVGLALADPRVRAGAPLVR
ncbi:MAG TPA: ABC transporter permease [Candidatus Polarisedimenticolaceae bacterium]|nr:ABC transporter permease [Candidatus Polarisedimenticolaceae bacterium]